MTRRFLTALFLPLLLWATALSAQDAFTGRFTFSQGPGSPALIILELAETENGIIGIGQSTADLPIVGGAVVTVTGGAAFEGNLQLELDIDPFDDAAAGMGARFQVIDGSDPVASLIYAGQTLHGVLLPQDTGTAQPQRPAADTTCADMTALTEQLNLTATSEVVPIIRGIYSNAGLAFGGQQTPEKCGQALRELQNLVVELEEGAAGEGAPGCDALDRVLDDVFIEFERLGMIESGYLDTVLANAGLQIADLNPNGVWNEANCARARPDVDAYLATLRTLPVETTPESGGTEMVVLPVRGFAPADGGNNVELWGHNGSQMAFETSFNGFVSIWYWAPRDGLTDVGVRQGTLLFSGEQSGTFIEGEAMIFTQDCGVFGYRVGGSWFDGASQLVLTGTRPVVDAQCRVTGSEPDRLVFDFISFEPSSAPDPVQPQQPTQQTQTQPEAPGGTQSNAIILTPIGAATITNNDLLRPQPQPQVQSTADAVENFDTPGFGVWAEVYEVYDVSDTLNMRSGPGTNFSVTAELPRFARDILVMGQGCTPDLDQIAYSEMSVARQAQVLSSRWCQVMWNGRIGWVYGRYIRPY